MIGHDVRRVQLEDLGLVDAVAAADEDHPPLGVERVGHRVA